MSAAGGLKYSAFPWTSLERGGRNLGWNEDNAYVTYDGVSLWRRRHKEEPDNTGVANTQNETTPEAVALPWSSIALPSQNIVHR